MPGSAGDSRNQPCLSLSTGEQSFAVDREVGDMN